MKIGLFDSGVGGLTCLNALIHRFPQHDYVYLGDTARLPYGTKSQDTIQKYARQNIQFLKSKNVDLVISACHSASSAILNFKLIDSVPIHEVISPICQSLSKDFLRVGLMATSSTVESGIYESALRENRPTCTLFSQPCSLLVPLVENNWVNDPITDAVLERYIAPLLKSSVESIILGCTHFPALKDAIQKIVGPEILLIDPGESLARALEEKMKTNSPGTGSLELFITDDAPHFVALARTLLAPTTDFSLELCHI